MRHICCTLLCGIVLLILATCSQAATEIQVLRDSIGVDGSLTDGLGGASALHDGGLWNTPDMVVDVPETGDLAEVKIVIFAGTPDGQPENTLANILGFNMDFHIWSDGIQSGPDSFFDNAEGRTLVPGHTEVAVNRPTASFISVQAFGITGPPVDPALFTTFIVTIDLSSFNLELQGGQQYVLGVTNPFGNFITGAATFRQIHSRATGFEDLFQADDTPLAQLPGFLNSQHFFGVDQLAGSVSIEVPVLGDMNGDGNVDGNDTPLFIEALVNRPAYDAHLFPVDADINGDVNQDGTFDTGDTGAFSALLGGPASAASVPEPSAFLLALFALAGVMRRRF